MSLAKILWVDDEMESLKSQIMFLENKGYEVKSLSNGFDAIDYVKDNEVDVVLLDESMPGISGLETLQKIKELKALIIEKNSSALIEIDGGVSLENAKEIIDAGADVLVTGNAVFSSEDPKETIEKLKRL